MLIKEDLEQIREVVTDVVVASEKRVITTIIEAVGEMINDNIVPQLDAIYRDIGELKTDVHMLKEDVFVLKQDVSVLKKDVSEIKQEICTVNAKMVTKGVLEDRLVDFRLSLSPKMV